MKNHISVNITSYLRCAHFQLRRFFLDPFVSLWRRVFGHRNAYDADEQKISRKSSLQPQPSNADETNENNEADEFMRKAMEEKDRHSVDAVNSTSEEESEEPGMWDEHYKSHFDSKPFGENKSF